MTFTELQTEILDRLNLSSTSASTRIGRAINRKYRLITSSIGLQLSRRATVQQTVTIGVSQVIFTNTEKVISVSNRNVTPYRLLKELTIEELRAHLPYSSSDAPTSYAIVAQASDSITIEINCVPQTGIALYADVHQAVTDLAGSNEPAFPKSFHDIIIEGVIADELRKMEKPGLSQIAAKEYERILSDLRMWIAKSNYIEVYQGKTADSRSALSGSGSGSSGSVNGALSYTQTGLITFDRDPLAPFAVTAASAVVPNLDADKLDGQHGSFYQNATNINAGTIADGFLPTTMAGKTLTTATITAPAISSPTVTSGTFSSPSISSPTLTGVPVAPTAALGTSTTQVATTAFAQTMSSPAFAGVPTAPTVAVGTNTTQLATTAFVQAAVDNGINDFRLTLTTGTPVTTADVTGASATTIFCTPYRGNHIALFDSAGVATVYTSAQFSIAVPATTSQMYDVFAFNNAGVPTLELLAWTNDTTRATAIVLTTTGTYTKSGDLTRRYLGSFRTTTVSGQTEDSTTKRYLWNNYNRLRRTIRVVDGTATWTYTTATWRQARASAANQADVVVGVAEAHMFLALRSGVSNSNASAVTVAVNLGEDSTTTPMSTCPEGLGSVLSSVATIGLNTNLSHYPAVGRHFYAWLEISSATGTTTWNGANGFAGNLSGVIGFIEG